MSPHASSYLETAHVCFLGEAITQVFQRGGDPSCTDFLNILINKHF